MPSISPVQLPGSAPHAMLGWTMLALADTDAATGTTGVAAGTREVDGVAEATAVVVGAAATLSVAGSVGSVAGRSSTPSVIVPLVGRTVLGWCPSFGDVDPRHAPGLRGAAPLHRAALGEAGLDSRSPGGRWASAASDRSARAPATMAEGPLRARVLTRDGLAFSPRPTSPS